MEFACWVHVAVVATAQSSSSDALKVCVHLQSSICTTVQSPAKVAPLHSSLNALTMNIGKVTDAPAARDLIAAVNARSAAELAAELRASEAGDGQDVRPVGHEPMEVDCRRPDGAQHLPLPARPACNERAGHRELELVQILEGHTDRVWAVAWSPDGERLSQALVAARVWLLRLCDCNVLFGHSGKASRDSKQSRRHSTAAWVPDSASCVKTDPFILRLGRVVLCMATAGTRPAACQHGGLSACCKAANMAKVWANRKAGIIDH